VRTGGRGSGRPGPFSFLAAALPFLLAPALAGGAAPVPTPAPARVIRGLTRAGGNLLGARWRPGRLEIRQDTLLWTDAGDPSRNLFLPLERLAEHALICRGTPKGEVCDVWLFRTSDGETERFRDPEGESGACARAAEAFEAVLLAAPEVAAGRRPSRSAR
jgi:hypothetical protein